MRSTLALLLVSMTLAPAAGDPFCHTFSIVAYDPDSKSYAVAVSTMPTAVGAMVPWAQHGVGAIATQARVNAGFGPRGLKLLAGGKSAKETLDALLKDDDLREERQIGIVDAKGDVAAFTGSKCMDWAGDRQGDRFTVQGNILVSDKTVDAMKSAFEKKEAIPFPERVMRALEAGLAAGGDKRGHRSAAILVVADPKSVGLGDGYDRAIDLRVDDHPTPVAELRRLFNQRVSGVSKPGDRTLERPSGADVTAAASALRRLGYYEGEPPKVFDDALADAVRRFRRDAGFADGEAVDRAVFDAMKAREKEGFPLTAGAAAVEITPDITKPVWMAGFSPGKRAQEVHDPLWARALVLKCGPEEAAIVSLDLIGLLLRDVREIRREASKRTGLREDRVIVACTHNHNGPDTVGLWGEKFGLSGVDPEYMKSLKAKAVEAIEAAWKKRAESTVRAATANHDKYLGDSREPKVMNPEARALLFEAAGKPVAILANYACHPEALGSKNLSITSDYPHDLREAMEKRYAGATCVFVSADLGGLQSPRVPERSWDACREMGEAIAGALGDALDAAKPQSPRAMRGAARRVDFEVVNLLFKGGGKTGLFGETAGYMDVRADGSTWIHSELTALRIGDGIMLVTVPGEVFPELAKEIYAGMKADVRIMVGLGNDELGYIMPESDFKWGQYCESMSLGPKTGTTLVEAAKELLKGF